MVHRTARKITITTVITIVRQMTISSTVTGTVPYKEGIYYGTAEGYSGDVSVAVVIQEKTIKAILITESSDDEAFFNRAMDVVKKVIQDTEDRRCRYSVRSNL